MFEALGHDLTIVFPASGSTWGTPSGGTAATTPVRGILMPAGAQRRQAAGAGALPVPAFVAYLPFDAADLSTPGWHLRFQDQTYYPTRDAVSPGNQGLLWVCELGSPGEVTSGPG